MWLAAALLVLVVAIEVILRFVLAIIVVVSIIGLFIVELDDLMTPASLETLEGMVRK